MSKGYEVSLQYSKGNKDTVLIDNAKDEAEAIQMARTWAKEPVTILGVTIDATKLIVGGEERAALKMRGKVQ